MTFYKLLPGPSFCLWDHQDSDMPCLRIPACCFKSPGIGRKVCSAYPGLWSRSLTPGPHPTGWRSVESSTHLFTRVSTTFYQMSEDTTTKLIINLWLRASMCQVHQWMSFCLNILFIIDNLGLAHKSNNQTQLWFRAGIPHRCHCSLPHEDWNPLLELPLWHIWGVSVPCWSQRLFCWGIINCWLGLLKNRLLVTGQTKCWSNLMKTKQSRQTYLNLLYVSLALHIRF